MDIKKLKTFYNTSFGSFLAADAVFCTLLVAVMQDNASAQLEKAMYIMAAVFWTMLLISIITLIVASVKHRQIHRQIKDDVDEFTHKKIFLFGAINFFKNKKALAADIVLIVSLAVTIAAYLLRIELTWSIVILVTLVITSFIFHSFWNGKIYMCINYLKNKEKISDDK